MEGCLNDGDDDQRDHGREVEKSNAGYDLTKGGQNRFRDHVDEVNKWVRRASPGCYPGYNYPSKNCQIKEGKKEVQ